MSWIKKSSNKKKVTNEQWWWLKSLEIYHWSFSCDHDNVTKWQGTNQWKPIKPLVFGILMGRGTRKSQWLYLFKCVRRILYCSIYCQVKANIISKVKEKERKKADEVEQEGKIEQILTCPSKTWSNSILCALPVVKQQRIHQEIKIDLTFETFRVN